MKKKSGKTLMQKWKNKIGGKLSALDKQKRRHFPHGRNN